MCGFCLIQVVRIRTDAVRDIGQKVQHTPVAAAVYHACVCRWVPPTENDGNRQRLEQLHNIQRLVLDHHLIRHACRHNNGEQGCECHTHLQYPPITSSGSKHRK